VSDRWVRSKAVRGASDKWALVLIPSVGGRVRKEKEIRGLLYKSFLSRAGDRCSTWQFQIG
jgi:hypothetical protein